MEWAWVPGLLRFIILRSLFFLRQFSSHTSRGLQVLSLSPHLDERLPNLLPSPLMRGRAAGVGLFSAFSDGWDTPPPFLPSHPKGESLECYKLTGREHYKLTNRKLPKEDTPSEQGTERTLGRELSRSHTEHFHRQEGCDAIRALWSGPRAGLRFLLSVLHLLLARPGQLSTLEDSALQCFQSKVLEFYSSQRRFSHTFKLNSNRAVDNIPIRTGFLLTCGSLVTFTSIFFPRLLLKSPIG